MIDETIEVNFEVPELLRNAMEEAEKAYAESGEFGPYMNWAQTIDNICKMYYTDGFYTRSQWDTVARKYQV